MAAKTSTRQKVRTTKAQRAWAARESEHSLRMEGLELSEETKADTRRFVAGEITADEGLARTLARHRRN
ncbi:hypothetical protein HDA30_000303 [Micrococcus cohnii]|uniref:Antitoxin VbhA domain-containing protein n=1 Tax=Micrococcus cohnii TaxID=993416 RepID=A0A7W7GME4_9MICC|nr:antitoxin VbhA family protein [Micrococcus cohnii]MBB4734795.1 hypothetical protein [Micrococcus cohnii]